MNEPFRGRWAVLALLLTAVFMDMVDNQIVTIALPTIQRDLGAPDSALQWTATGYTLAFALLVAASRSSAPACSAPAPCRSACSSC